MSFIPQKFIKKLIHVAEVKLVYDYNIKAFTQHLKASYGDKPLIGAEIGVYHGNNAVSMLKNLNIETLYLIDPYKLYPEYAVAWGDGTPETQNSQATFDKEYIMMCKRMEKYLGRVMIIREFADDACKRFFNGELDFVYNDSRHEYNPTINDFERWYPIVKKGGVYGGHGFDAHWDTAFAVVDICRKYNLKINGTTHDWWIDKIKEEK
jgi:hypothetical protein